MIRCISDDVGFKTKYIGLCRSIFSGSGLKGVSDIMMVAMMKEGYFVISACVKGPPKSPVLSECGRFDHLEDKLMFHLNPSSEPKLPKIMSMLRSRYGKDNVVEVSRYDIAIPADDVASVGALIIEDNDRLMIENLSHALMQIRPEGFRIMRSMRGSARLTVLCSLHPLRNEWIERMEEIHERPDPNDEPFQA